MYGIMTCMELDIMTAEDLAAKVGTSDENVRRAARKYKSTPHAFGRYLGSAGKRGRWIFEKEDIGRWAALPEAKRPHQGGELRHVHVMLEDALLARVDALSNNRTTAIREGLELWLKRQERRAKSSKG